MYSFKSEKGVNIYGIVVNDFLKNPDVGKNLRMFVMSRPSHF